MAKLILILYLLGVGAGIGVVFLTAGSGPLFISALAMVVAYFVLVFLVQSTIQSIFVVELYRYGMTGQATLLPAEDLQGAFKPKIPQN